MPNFGKTSKSRLGMCHPKLQLVFNEVIKVYDCSVLCGERNKEEQDYVYSMGWSKLKYPDSKHNKVPSEAVDVVPWFINKPHIRWEDKHKFYQFSGVVITIADRVSVKLRWGGNWDGDEELHDQSFMDLPHWELIGD